VIRETAENEAMGKRRVNHFEMRGEKGGVSLWPQHPCLCTGESKAGLSVIILKTLPQHKSKTLPNENHGSNQGKNKNPSTLSSPVSIPPDPSNRTGLLQQPWQLGPSGLQIGIATDMHLFDEDIGHGALMGDLLEGILYGGAVGHLVQLHDEVVGAELAEEGLGRPAVATV